MPINIQTWSHHFFAPNLTRNEPNNPCISARAQTSVSDSVRPHQRERNHPAITAALRVAKMALHTGAPTTPTFVDPALPPGQHVPFPSIASAASIELSVVVPAYNESVRLPQMLEETLAYLQTRAARPTRPPFTFEVIVVDDGSKDDTADVAQRYVQRHGARVMRVLKLSPNQGKGGAVREGVLCARGRFVLMADADAATLFADVEKLEAVMSRADVDVVIGSRVHLKGRGAKEGRGWLRGFVSTVFNLVVVYVGGVTGLRDTQCGFKLYSRQAARVAFGGQMLRRWAFDVENLYRVQRAGMNIVEVPVQWTEVPGSKLSVVKATVNMMMDMLRMRYKYVTGAWGVSAPVLVGE